jgi:VCBS repeat-containing protein
MSEFYEGFYLANNPDVAKAVDAGAFGTGWEHYSLFGQAEGRSFAEPAGYGEFNEQFYLANNADVAKAVETGAFGTGWEHYSLFGQDEGRSFAEPAGYGEFNEQFYLANNADVALAVDAGLFGTGWEHYSLFGQDEGRSFAEPAGYGEFNELFYLASNADVAKAVESGAFATGWQHYQLFGEAEGRTFVQPEPVGEAILQETAFAAPDEPAPVEGETFTLTEAMAEEELPAEYNIDATAVVEAGDVTVAQAQEAFAAVTAILEGALNQDDLAAAELFTWNVVDDADAIIAAIENAAVTGATTVMVNNETLTREQLDALNVLANIDLEGVDVENTAPEAVEVAAEVAEDATFEGQLEATDPDVADQGDELTFALAEGQEAVEGFTLNADGSYSFDAAQEAFQALQAGETQDVTVNYTVTDSAGETSTDTLTLTVTGTDDAPAVAIAEGTENDLLTDQVFGAEDAITDVDGFGGGATVTLSYDEAVEAAGQYGTPSFKTTDEFRVVRDGNEFTLIAKAGQNGFTTATTIGTVTPVGVTEVLDAEGDVTGYTQTGYTLELNDKVTPEVLTALLQEWNVQEAADKSNTQLTVSIASEGGAEPVEFVRNIKGTDAGAVSLAGTESALEAELTDGALHTEAADVPFAPFGAGVDFTGGVAAIAGMDVTLSSTNAADAFAFADATAFNNQFEVVTEQLIFTGGEGEDVVVADITGLGSNEVSISFRDTLPADFDQEEIDALLQNLQIDLEDTTGDRTVSLNVTSGDGLSEASLTREISVLDEFTEVTLAEIAAADVETDAESVVTIDGNTLLNVNGFGDELDIQAQIDAGNLVVEGTNPIRVIVGADGANLSDVTGLELLGDLRIQQVTNGVTLTLDATQIDFLSTAGEVDGAIAVTGLEGNTDADLSVLEAAEGVTATISAEAGDVTFTGDFGTAEVTVGADSTLTATAAILDGVTVTGNGNGNGNVVVTDLDGEAAYDLAGLVNATATLAAETVTTLNEETDLGTVAVTVPQNSELVLTAEQANNADISGGDVTGDGNKGGSVTVVGLADDVNLSSVNTSSILAGAVNASQSDLIVTFRAEDEEVAEERGDDGIITNVDLGTFIVQVQEGATLRIDQGTANGAIITGAGNVEVTVDNADALDLSTITATGSKTVVVGTTVDLSKYNVDFGDFAVNVAADTTLTLTAAQASGLSITGADADAETTGGSIEIALDGDAAYNLANITAGAGYDVEGEVQGAGSLTATVVTNNDEAAAVVLDEATNLGGFSLVLEDDLELSAAQANAREITGTADDSVTVNGLAADTDLSNVAADIDVTANVAESIDISANENLTTVDTFHVLNDASLTLTARQADEQAITAADAIKANAETEAQAAGTIVVAGPLEAEQGDEPDNAIDFTSIEKPFTFAGGELVVAEGVELTLTAAQADGKVITGAGNVVVTELGDAAVDLSGVTVTGTKTANVEDSDNAVTLNAATDLGDFTLDVQTDNILTLTAAQAATAVLVGAGTAVINGTAAGETLDFSGKTDWTIDTLEINGDGGADVLEAPQNVANVTLVGGTGGDTFVVNGRTTTLEDVTPEPVTIGDFNFNSDELVIANSGEATLDLNTATGLVEGGFDLAKLETLGRYSNEGVLNVVGSVTSLTGEVGDLSGATAVTVQLAADGSDADLSDVDLDDNVTAIDLNGRAATLTAAQAGLTVTGGSYAVVDTVANLTGDQGDLSGATSVTAMVESTDTDLTDNVLDDNVTAIDLNGQDATLTVDQAGLALSDSSSGGLATRAITIADTFDANVDYSALTAGTLGVSNVTLDDSDDNAATIDYTDATNVNSDANTTFATDDAITVSVDGDSDDLTAITATNIGGSSVTVDDTTDDAYTLSEANFNTAFNTNGLATAAGDTITVTGLTAAFDANGQDANIIASGDFDLTGGNGDDQLTGGAGNNIITGGAGADTITGGAGADTITPGLGADTIVNADIANEGLDVITNFTTAADGAGFGEGADTLQFSDVDLTGQTGFADAAAGGAIGTLLTLNDSTTMVEFITGSGAAADEAVATFAFDTDTNTLSFDADGTGGTAAAINVLQLTGVTDLAAGDFTFVA